jgi:hypothetical protein
MNASTTGDPTAFPIVDGQIVPDLDAWVRRRRRLASQISQVTGPGETHQQPADGGETTRQPPGQGGWHAAAVAGPVLASKDGPIPPGRRLPADVRLDRSGTLP